MLNFLQLPPRQQNRIELLAEIKLARRLAGEALVSADRALAKKYNPELARLAEDLRNCVGRMDAILEGGQGMGLWGAILVLAGIALTALFGKDAINALLKKISGKEESGESEGWIDRGVKIAAGLTLVGIGVYAVTR